MNHYIHILVAVTVLMPCASWAGDGQRVLCVGDSITAADHSWVSLIAKSGKIETINAGQGGRRTGAAVETFETAVTTSQSFNRVIFFLGVNDLPGRDPAPPDKKVALCVKNMELAIDRALKTLPAKDVILVAPCNVNAELMRQPHKTDAAMTKRRERNVQKGYDICPPILEKLESAYRQLAQKKGVQFVSLLRVVSPANFPDGLHPDNAGQRQIADAIQPVLVQTWKPGGKVQR
ncbi:MAG: hypothetical protein PCFJNLEI_00555 [Verrucomicrobiae bacterium]|nr:hypothetical protein [Verrucomicrobiae bacterium]